MSRWPLNRCLLIDGQRVTLTAREVCCFAALFNARGLMLSRLRLFEVVYGEREDGGPFDRQIELIVLQLRRKLACTSFRIVSQWGRGYRLARLPKGAPLFAPTSRAA
jgi:DNA-binding response OmpR family regulator